MASTTTSSENTNGSSAITTLPATARDRDHATTIAEPWKEALNTVLQMIRQGHLNHAYGPETGYIGLEALFEAMDYAEPEGTTPPVIGSFIDAVTAAQSHFANTQVARKVLTFADGSKFTTLTEASWKTLAHARNACFTQALDMLKDLMDLMPTPNSPDNATDLAISLSTEEDEEVVPIDCQQHPEFAKLVDMATLNRDQAYSTVRSSVHDLLKQLPRKERQQLSTMISKSGSDWNAPRATLEKILRILATHTRARLQACTEDKRKEVARKAEEFAATIQGHITSGEYFTTAAPTEAAAAPEPKEKHESWADMRDDDFPPLMPTQPTPKKVKQPPSYASAAQSARPATRTTATHDDGFTPVGHQGKPKKVFMPPKEGELLIHQPNRTKKEWHIIMCGFGSACTNKGCKRAHLDLTTALRDRTSGVTACHRCAISIFHSQGNNCYKENIDFPHDAELELIGMLNSDYYKLEVATFVLALRLENGKIIDYLVLPDMSGKKPDDFLSGPKPLMHKKPCNFGLEKEPPMLDWSQ